MSFEFEVYSADGEAPKGNASSVDLDALNKYVVETCGLQNGDVLVGYISVLYDLGVQQPKDSEFVFKGTAADEATAIEKNPAKYFKDGLDDKGQPARLECAPVKPFQHVTFAVDFPEIMLNKGQFFGDVDTTKPLRLYLGGDYWMGADIGKVVQNPLSMKNTTKTGSWSFDSKSTIYKMAVGAKLIVDGQPFESKRVGDLIGKSLQFKVKIDLSESKGKFYLNEKIGFQGGLGRGQASLTPVTTLAYIGFKKDNDLQAVKEMPRHIVNTVKRASNYVGSQLEQQMLSLLPVQAQQQDETPEVITDDDNLPF
jgi:hypothetical protein